MIIKNKGERKEKKRKKYYEGVEELEVDGRIAAVETGRVAKGVEERVELFVGGSMVEELEVDGRVASVEAGRVAKGVEVVELFVGGLAVEELEVDDRVAAVEAGRLTEGVDEKVAEGSRRKNRTICRWLYTSTINKLHYLFTEKLASH